MFTLIAASIFIFFIVIAYFQRKDINRDGWLYANKNVSYIFSLFSVVSTTIGGSATIVTGYMVFRHGWSGLAADLPIGIGMLALGLFFSEKIRKSGASTVPEYLGEKYGETMRKISALAIIITEIAWFGLLIKAFTVFIPSNTLFPTQINVLSIGFLFLVYIYIGGQKSVYATDFFQGLIILSGFAYLLYAIGFAEAPANLSHPPITPLGFKESSAYFLMMFLAGLAGPDILSRVFFAEKGKTAKKALISGGFIKIAVSVCIGFLTIKGRALLPADINGYQFFPEIFKNILGPVSATLMIIVFLLIMVSSADTVLMTAIATLNNDLWKFKRLSLKSIRFQVWILGIPGILLALYFSTVLDIMKFAYSFYAAGPALFIVYRSLGLNLRPNRATAIFLIAGLSGITAALITGDSIGPVLLAIAVNIALTFFVQGR